jgi:hypothetical protein
MTDGKTSLETRKKVYAKWDGKCAFCGVSGTIEEHHIVALSENLSLSDDPDNLILLCSHHHTLTRKKNDDGTFAISSIDITDLKNSKYNHAAKRGFSFEMPEKFAVIFGKTRCFACPILLEINGKPLIEIKSQYPVWYTRKQNYYLFVRFFDDQNNFVGGMFANYWAAVANEEWEIETTNNKILVKNVRKPIFIQFLRQENTISITGQLWYDRVKIEVTPQHFEYGGNIVSIGTVVGVKVLISISTR